MLFFVVAALDLYIPVLFLHRSC